MKNINTFEEVANNVLSANKKDIIVPSHKLRMLPPENDTGAPLLTMGGNGARLTDTAHKQMATYTGIPNNYYQKLKESSGLMLAGNVNYWLENMPVNKDRMVRMLNGDIRALLSSSYMAIDNDLVIKHALPEVQKIGSDLYPIQAYATDDYMSLKFVHTSLKGSIDGKGEVSPGISITNSETGNGRFNVQGFFFDSFCTNGCIWNLQNIDLQIKQVHRGSRLQQGVVSRETVGHIAAGYASATADIIRYLFSDTGFNNMLDTLRETREGEEVKPVHAADMVKHVGQQYQLTEEERAGMLESLMERNDFTRWGVLSAVTEQANTTDNNDRIMHLENVGARIIDLQREQWNRIVNRVNSTPIKVA